VTYAVCDDTRAHQLVETVAEDAIRRGGGGGVYKLFDIFRQSGRGRVGSKLGKQTNSVQECWI
jgi:hypothetical protein